MEGNFKLLISLSGAEWKLLVELLERELNDLPDEIHHTDSRPYREDLIRRREAAQHLLAHLHAQAPREPESATR